MSNLQRYRCKAKDVRICAYHGAAIRMEEAAEVGNYPAYEAAKADFEAAAQQVRAREGLRSALTGEEVIPNPAKAPDNPMRFGAWLTIEPRDDNTGVTHRIDVHAASRAEAMDKLVHATKAYVDGLRASKQRLSWKHDDYTVAYSIPQLDGRTDDSSTGGGGIASLNALVERVGRARELEVRMFNSHLLAHKAANGTMTTEERAYYKQTERLGASWNNAEVDWINPKHDATQLAWPGEEPGERKKRQAREDRMHELRRLRNREAADEKRRNEARVAKQEAAAAEARAASRRRARAQAHNREQAQVNAKMRQNTRERDTARAKAMGLEENFIDTGLQDLLRETAVKHERHGHASRSDDDHGKTHGHGTAATEHHHNHHDTSSNHGGGAHHTPTDHGSGHVGGFDGGGHHGF